MYPVQDTRHSNTWCFYIFKYARIVKWGSGISFQVHTTATDGIHLLPWLTSLMIYIMSHGFDAYIFLRFILKWPNAASVRFLAWVITEKEIWTNLYLPIKISQEIKHMYLSLLYPGKLSDVRNRFPLASCFSICRLMTWSRMDITELVDIYFAQWLSSSANVVQLRLSTENPIQIELQAGQ